MVGKHEEPDILKRIGKDAGFKVPENYFAEFNARMAQELPEVTITEVNEKPSLWLRVRPYVYLAAMFAGVWCTMKVFTGITTNQMSTQQRMSEIAPGIIMEQNADEFLNYGVASDYDIMTYEDSVQMDVEIDANK